MQCLINYLDIISQGGMNQQQIQHYFPSSMKEAQSKITNINPEQSQSQLYGSFTSPEHYKLHQSFFDIDELRSQDGYEVIFKTNYLYFGGMYKGMKHGFGVLQTEDTVYEGEFSLNFKSGKGYQKFPNGSVYIGDFENNRTHGEGSLRYNDEYYIGDFQNGCMQGDGIWRNKQGDKYIGQWKNNKAHGYGIYITRSSHYQGYFSKFVKQGEGLQQFKNGDIYRGLYQNGVPNGYGQYYWKDGSTYKGNFSSGLRQGKGVWTNSKGDHYEGQFKNDKKNGFGVFLWQNGNKYEGNFVNDVRQGEGIMTWNDGSTYKGDWKNGNPNGLGTYKAKGQKGKTGLYENNVLIKQIKPNNYNDQNYHKELLVLSMIPEITRKASFVKKTYKSKNIHSRVTNDTSFGRRTSHRWPQIRSLFMIFLYQRFYVKLDQHLKCSLQMFMNE